MRIICINLLTIVAVSRYNPSVTVLFGNLFAVSPAAHTLRLTKYVVVRKMAKAVLVRNVNHLFYVVCRTSYQCVSLVYLIHISSIEIFT